MQLRFRCMRALDEKHDHVMTLRDGAERTTGTVYRDSECLRLEHNTTKQNLSHHPLNKPKTIFI